MVCVNNWNAYFVTNLLTKCPITFQHIAKGAAADNLIAIMAQRVLDAASTSRLKQDNTILPCKANPF